MKMSRPADLKMLCPLPDVVDKEQKDPEVFDIRKRQLTSNSDDIPPSFVLFRLIMILILILMINSQLFRRQILVLRRFFSDHLVRPVHEALAAAAVNFVFENRLKVGS